MPSLVGRDGTRFGLQSGRITTIGRSHDNDIVLRHRSVSRHHAVVQNDGGKFFLKDLNSSNGTWVGNRRAESVQLTGGVVLRFGDLQLTFDEHRQAASAQGKPAPRPSANARSHHAAVEVRSIGLLVKSVAAIAIACLLAFAVTEFKFHRPSGTSSAANETNPASATAGSDNGLSAANVGRAIVETDNKHVGDSSWISADATAEMCDQKALLTDSAFCRAAYLGRHAESKNLGPPQPEDPIPFPEIIQFCDNGMVDQKSSVCTQAYSARPAAANHRFD